MRKPLIMFVSLCLILTFTSLSFLNTNLALSQPIIPQATTETVPEFHCYRSQTEVYARMAELKTQYSTLVQRIDIGDSWQKQASGVTEGYDLIVLKLTNQNINETKPALFVVSALHSRDLAPVELNLRFAEMLLDGYGDDPDITWLLDKTEIDLLIIANPDGRAVVEQQIASGFADEFGSYARKKNLNANTCSDPTDTGTDLEHNFAFQWRSFSTGCENDYPGSASHSEPETSAIQTYMQTLFGDFRDGGPDSPADPQAKGLLINLQSYGDRMYYPYFYSSTPAPEKDELYALANKLAYGTLALPERYPVISSGGIEDYAYGELGIPALAFAIGDASHGSYFTFCNTFNSNLSDNLNSLLHAAKTVFAPYSLPLGPEITSITLVPIQEEGQTHWQLQATANSRIYKYQSADYPTIASAVYSFDRAPWESGAQTHLLLAADGNFDESIEELVETLNLTGLVPGQHRVYVQASNVNNIAGLAATGSIMVEEPPDPTPTVSPTLPPFPGAEQLYLPIVFH